MRKEPKVNFWLALFFLAALLPSCSLIGKADVRIANAPSSLQWKLGDVAPTITLTVLVKGPSPQSELVGYRVVVYDKQNTKLLEKTFSASIATLPRVPDPSDKTADVSFQLPLSELNLAAGSYVLEIAFRVKAPSGEYYLSPVRLQVEVLPSETTIQPPTVEFVNVNDGQVLTGNVSVRLQVHTAPGTDVDSVKLYLRSQKVGEVKGQASVVIPVDTTQFPNGDAELRAEATARKGELVSFPGVATITVKLSNKIPPTLQIAEPTDGSKISGTLPVVVVVQKQTTPFTYQGPIVVNLYDYDNHLVDRREITAPDDQDFVGRIDPVFDISDSYRPNDVYYVEAHAVVRLEGDTADRVLTSRVRVTTYSESNLPPALRIDYPFRLQNYDVSTSPATGVPVIGDYFGVMGLVTDDSGKVHAIEVRLICDGSIPTVEDDGCKENPINALMPYLASPYGWYSEQIVTNATPYIPDGLYILKVVAIDNDDVNLRNTQEIVVRVDRTATAEADRQVLLSNPIALVDSQDPPDDQLIVAPGTASWTLDLSSAPNPVVMHLALISTSDPQTPIEIVTATIPAGGSYTYRRSFNADEKGVYTIWVGLMDTVTGATVFRSDAPTLTVESP